MRVRRAETVHPAASTKSPERNEKERRTDPTATADSEDRLESLFARCHRAASMPPSHVLLGFVSRRQTSVRFNRQRQDTSGNEGLPRDAHDKDWNVYTMHWTAATTRYMVYNAPRPRSP